jgi:hypothetical protein
MGRLSPSPAFFAESLSICAEASRNILAIINRFRDFRQLECHPQVASRLFTRLTIAERFYDSIGKPDDTLQPLGKERQNN